MFLPLTENFIANKFYQNCGKPFYNKSQRLYQGSCPICREGRSWLKKKRCYYIVEKNVVCCHNCGWYSTPYNWILKVTGNTFQELKKELEDYKREDYNEIVEVKQEKPRTPTESLPQDAINLFDDNQVNYFKQNVIIKDALSLIKNRRLQTAVNRSKALYISISDKVHDNRLIIPFYDTNNKIIFYQSRKILPDDTRAKYLSKVGSERSLYGINNINSQLEYFFITEGPIDAMFLKNGIALCGINEGKNNNLTSVQQAQLLQFPLFKKIWVLDNQMQDNASKIKTNHLINAGETVFIWPKSLQKYKDINEYCVDSGVDELDTDIVLSNCYSGLKAKLMMNNY